MAKIKIDPMGGCVCRLAPDCSLCAPTGSVKVNAPAIHSTMLNAAYCGSPASIPLFPPYLLFSCFVWPVAGKIEKFHLIHAARINVGMGR
jgi:hypothetical protein